MLRIKYLIVMSYAIVIAHAQPNKVVYKCASGKINFMSDAPMEIIKASSNKLSGIIDVSKRTFAFSVVIRTFEGFNLELQREHFNENYMESEKFPTADFKGKIIEDIDLSKDGIYNIRAKGTFMIHGIEQERIIKVLVKVENGNVHVNSKFMVLLNDHNIKVPKVVNEKISSEVEVKVDAELK